MNGYKAFYKSKVFEVYAETSFEAQKKVAEQHKIKQRYLITIMLCEKNNKQILHKATF